MRKMTTLLGKSRTEQISVLRSLARPQADGKLEKSTFENLDKAVLVAGVVASCIIKLWDLIKRCVYSGAGSIQEQGLFKSRAY